jgi:hypothetical protein
VRVVAPAAQGLRGEDDGTADEEVLGILQRRSGYGGHRAAESAVVGVATVVVLGVLDDTRDPAGEVAAQGVERGGEVAADVKDDLAPSGALFEVAQDRFGVGEQVAVSCRRRSRRLRPGVVRGRVRTWAWGAPPAFGYGTHTAYARGPLG